MTEHIVNISGGKDSTACYLLAIMRGKTFRAVTADTGHEHPITYEYISTLHEKTGGPKVEIVRQDFSSQISRKRETVKTKWVNEGVEDCIIQAALEVLHPTGNPFIDLCIWKGRFPSRRAQFCTEWLKSNPISEQVFNPARLNDVVVSWQGERRAESPNRANLPRFQKLTTKSLCNQLTFRPILHWSAENVFDLHKIFEIEPNPLYRQGMKRVGCWPCINSSKIELAAIFSRYPETIEKLDHYSDLVSRSSKRQASSFFAASTTPQGAKLARDQRDGNRLNEEFPQASEIAEWAKTSHGGKQYSALNIFDEGLSCTSHYGLCE